VAELRLRESVQQTQNLKAKRREYAQIFKNSHKYWRAERGFRRVRALQACFTKKEGTRVTELDRHRTAA
jgi:hypothetical protein